MAFQNILDDYTVGATASTTIDGQSVTVTVTEGENTNTYDGFTGAQIRNGDDTTVSFSEAVTGVSVAMTGLNEPAEQITFAIDGTPVSLTTLIANGDAVLSQSGVDAGGNLGNGGAGLFNEAVVTFTTPINTLTITGIGTLDSGYRVVDVGFDDVLAAICFTRDTLIDTDQGEVAVQDLAPDMMVRTRDNGFQPIRWVGMSPAKDRAVRIKAGALGNSRDLVVSPRHRMVLDGWQLEMLFDHDHALVTALELVNDDTIVRDEMADVEYYHVMFDKHEIIYAEGAATESFHPDQPSMGHMDAAAREEIFALFPELREGAKRPEAAPNLSAVQAAYVGKNLDAFVG